MYSSFISMKRLGDVRGPKSTNRSELKAKGWAAVANPGCSGFLVFFRGGSAKSDRSSIRPQVLAIVLCNQLR